MLVVEELHVVRDVAVDSMTLHLRSFRGPPWRQGDVGARATTGRSSGRATGRGGDGAHGGVARDAGDESRGLERDRACADGEGRRRG